MATALARAAQKPAAAAWGHQHAGPAPAEACRPPAWAQVGRGTAACRVRHRARRSGGRALSRRKAALLEGADREQRGDRLPGHRDLPAAGDPDGGASRGRYYLSSPPPHTQTFVGVSVGRGRRTSADRSHLARLRYTPRPMRTQSIPGAAPRRTSPARRPRSCPPFVGLCSGSPKRLFAPARESAGPLPPSPPA